MGVVGVDGHGAVRRGGGLSLKPPQPPPFFARNNKQTFSYSNKYQASGEHGGAEDKEEAMGEGQTGGWLLCYPEASLGSRARPEKSQVWQALTDL